MTRSDHDEASPGTAGRDEGKQAVEPDFEPWQEDRTELDLDDLTALRADLAASVAGYLADSPAKRAIEASRIAWLASRIAWLEGCEVVAERPGRVRASGYVNALAGD